jgi:hypothetical protein
LQPAEHELTLDCIDASLKTTGAAFLEALAARADPQTGLANLTIEDSVPFAEGILVLCVHMLECLILRYVALESEEAVVT